MQGVFANCFVRAAPAYTAEASGVAYLASAASLCAFFQGVELFGLPQTVQAAEYLIGIWYMDLALVGSRTAFEAFALQLNEATRLPSCIRAMDP